MPTINLPDDVYQYLSEVAARRGMTVDQHVASVLGPAAAIRTPAEREAAFQQHLELARARAHLYPPGFECDISRDAMYPESNEW